jgi:hypothetical protein
VKTPRSFHTLVVLVCFRGLGSIRSRKSTKNFRLRDRSHFFHDFLHGLGREYALPERRLADIYATDSVSEAAPAPPCYEHFPRTKHAGADKAVRSPEG